VAHYACAAGGTTADRLAAAQVLADRGLSAPDAGLRGQRAAPEVPAGKGRLVDLLPGGHTHWRW